MKVVDLANEVYLENDPQHTSIAAIVFFFRSNVGKLNSLLYEDFIVDPNTYEIIHKCNGHELSHRAAAIFKVIYQLYLINLDIRKMITSVNRDSILKATDQEFSVEKVNKSELLKTFTTLKKDTLKELFDLVHTYRSYHGAPSDVSGDDIIPGHFCGVEENGYVRELY